LTVAALRDRELDPGSRNVPAKADRRIARPQRRFGDSTGLRRTGAAVVQLHTAPQSIQRRLRRLALDLYPIGLGQLVFRIGDPRLQGAVVGEQQQSLAVVVEATRGPHARDGNETGQRLMPLPVGELRQYVVWLVEQDERHVRLIGVTVP